RVLAGGQSLIPAMRFRLARPAILVDINPLNDLNYLRLGDKVLAIGAIARDRDIERAPWINDRRWSLIHDASRVVADPVVRKVGDFATAAAAVQVSLKADGAIGSAGVALSAAGACAVRVEAAEQLLAGQKPSAALLRAASDAAWHRSAPQADLRGSVEFKKHL